MDYLITALISLASATLPCIVAIIQIRNESKKIREQHKVNIEAIREQHRLELIAKDKDYEHQKELLQKEHEYTLALKDKDLSNGFGAHLLNSSVDIASNLVQNSQHAHELTNEAFTKRNTSSFVSKKRK